LFRPPISDNLFYFSTQNEVFLLLSALLKNKFFSIKKIMNDNEGPYLILGSKFYLDQNELPHIVYDGTLKTLNKINLMEGNEIAVLAPSRQSTGINLTNIACIIFLEPAMHENNTVIQSIARATRVTSKNNIIKLYNIHYTTSDIFVCKTYVSENDIIKFCNEHNLTRLKHPRNKKYINDIINNLLRYTEYDKLCVIPNIYFALLLHLQKESFQTIRAYFSEALNVPLEIICCIVK
jgi:serine/threonine protein kinase